MLLPKLILIIFPRHQKNLHYFPKRTKKSVYFSGDLNKQINKTVPCFYFITPFLGCSLGLDREALSDLNKPSRGRRAL